MIFTINLLWLTFNVDLATIDAWMKANAGPSYCGISSNSKLQVHFTSDPGPAVAEAIQTYWLGLTPASPEATNYAVTQAMEESLAQAEAAIQFGSNLVVKIVAQNRVMGISGISTEDAIVTLLTPVLVALQAGSLEVAISRIKAIPPANYDATFVTAARLLAVVNQIETFLGIPLSASL